ncbi:MAG: hypothetical protein WC322_07090 [Candidatus Paceibacterota bacterium]|jgi:hypothetical protein
MFEHYKTVSAYFRTDKIHTAEFSFSRHGDITAVQIIIDPDKRIEKHEFFKRVASGVTFRNPADKHDNVIAERAAVRNALMIGGDYSYLQFDSCKAIWSAYRLMVNMLKFAYSKSPMILRTTGAGILTWDARIDGFADGTVLSQDGKRFEKKAAK